MRRTIGGPVSVADSGAAADEDRVELSVEGMTCSHCVSVVGGALRQCPGVLIAEVDLKGGRAAVVGSGLDVACLKRAVEGLGYRVAAVNTKDSPDGGSGGAE